MRIVLMILGIGILLGQRPEPAAVSCISGGLELFDAQGIVTDTAYRLARRSVVMVTAEDACGSGVVWELTKERIVIAASRHLLRKGAAAVVTLGADGNMSAGADGSISVQAESLGYSQQYDVGFLSVSTAEVPEALLRHLRAVRPMQYDVESEADRSAFAAAYVQWEIIQLGVDTESGGMGFFQGSITGVQFVPVFNAQMLETACYAKAGMSGGGVFDRYGRFWGLIGGGEVAEDAERREADVTYSLPPQTIEREYVLVMEANEE
ncbi:MAG: serine protease [Roseburia sp.]|nr:serine protease [Roseburia sp.]